MLLRHSCSINRNQAIGTNGRHAQTLLASDVKSMFIPMSSRAEMENQFSPGTAYDVYFRTNVDVKAQDQLLWDGDKFNVRAVREYKVPRIAHKHAIVTREAF